MTKTQELELLDRTIATFGRNSYLGPWLADVRDELRQTIMADLTPRPALPREAYAEAARTISDATAAADDIRARAIEAAATIRQTADRDLAELRRRTRAVLEQAASRL
jgi:hypothetical protein